MKKEFETYKFCPVCGTGFNVDDFHKGEMRFKCHNCNNYWFIKSKPTVSVIIPKVGDPSSVVLCRRATDPGKGFLDLPGGFVSYHETIESCAVREIQEELGIDIEVDKILNSTNNFYEFGSAKESIVSLAVLAYPTVTASSGDGDGEVLEANFFNLKNVLKDKSLFAFENEFEVLNKYLNSLKSE